VGTGLDDTVFEGRESDGTVFVGAGSMSSSA
jgi:hypothetical protein